MVLLPGQIFQGNAFEFLENEVDAAAVFHNFLDSGQVAVLQSREESALAQHLQAGFTVGLAVHFQAAQHHRHLGGAVQSIE